MIGSTYLGRLLMLSVLLWSSVAFSANVSPSMLKIERFNAKRGDAQSQYFMGEHYEQGDSGISRDLKTALQWYQQAAAKGHAAAQYKIGLFHEKGYLGLTGGMTAAMSWYEKAAAGGNDAARLKIEAVKKAEQEAADAKRRRQLEDERRKAEKQREREKERARMLRADKPAMAGLPFKIPKSQERKFSPEEMIDTLIASNWFYAGRPAEYLPTEDMSCLKSAELEVTCFSRARDRVVGKKRMEFTVKSVLDRFGSDGSFKARYFYNVAEIDRVATTGPATDSYGLRAEEGWQQPGHEVACHVNEANHVICRGDDTGAMRFDSK